MGLLCLFPEQVNTFLFKGKGFCKTKRAKISSPLSTFCGGVSRMAITKMLDIKEQKTFPGN